MNISKEKLTIQEINLLYEESKKSPDIGLINEKVWKQFKNIFILKNGKELIGVCVAVELKKWVKLGPIIIVGRYQGKGYGRLILTHVVKYYRNINLYIGSSNLKVVKIIRSLKFRKIGGFLSLPKEVRFYILFTYFIQRFSFEYVIDAFKKLLTYKREKYHYFLKYDKTYGDVIKLVQEK